MVFGDDPALKLYLESLKYYPLLSAEEEAELGLRSIKGDKEAREKLINFNLRLVVSIASSYKYLGDTILDVIQNGNLGLFPAASRWDPRKGTRFSTYATYWIKQSIFREASKTLAKVRLPVHVGYSASKLRQWEVEFESANMRQPTKEEYLVKLKELELPESFYEDYPLIKNIASLDSFVDSEESQTTLGDLIEDGSPSVEDYVIKSEVSDILLREINSKITKERERDMLIMRFGLLNGRAMTLEEVGKCFNVTRERVRQVEAKCIRKLKFSRALRELNREGAVG